MLYTYTVVYLCIAINTRFFVFQPLKSWLTFPAWICYDCMWGDFFRGGFSKNKNHVILYTDVDSCYVYITVPGKISESWFTLKALGWEVLPHPLYSPEIALSNYTILFRSMLSALSDQRFAKDEDINYKKWVDHWIVEK